MQEPTIVHPAIIDSESFWSNVQVGTPDECWPWLAARFPRGYGYTIIRRKNIQAHRLAYVLSHNTEISSDIVIRHRCDNPSCCNPNHLLPGTHLDNVRDRQSRGRQAKGDRCHFTKLTPADVLSIRSDTRSQRTIAKQYGVTKTAIAYIKQGRSWKHV